MNLSELDVFILAGGKGTRLKSVISDRSKVMASINKRPFLDYILEYLMVFGVDKVTLLTGYMSNSIRSYYSGNKNFMQISFSDENMPLGTGGAIKNALKRLQNRKELCLILNGDTYFPADLTRLIAKASVVSNILLTTRMRDASRYGSLSIDSHSGRVLDFTEKVISNSERSIYAGLCILESARVQSFAQSIFSLEKDFFPILIEKGILFGHEDLAEFIDIGIPDDFYSFKSKYE